MTLASIERDDRSSAFFDAAASGVLLFQRCDSCGYAQLPISASANSRCRRCRALTSWAPASGSARLVSWTASPVRTAEGASPGPVIGLPELQEGPWIDTQLRGVTGAKRELDESSAFRVAFERPDGSESIPVSEPGVPA